jgi:tRNA (cytidine/uridine-2'-O-)-methyltransferase
LLPEADDWPASRDDLHVVLVQPEIAWNTGNVGRSCLAAGAQLHLVRPLGFELDDRRVKRAGLDYWADVEPRVWQGFEPLQAHLAATSLLAVTGEATTTLWDHDLVGPVALVFGRETTGLPNALRGSLPQAGLPMAPGGVRSLNLSTAVGIALWETLRQRRARRPSRTSG